MITTRALLFVVLLFATPFCYGQIADGKYCADVHYNNPKTGTQSDYVLIVKVEDNLLTSIFWPSKGWLDTSHFKAPSFNANQFASFTAFNGHEYEVQITGSEKTCFNQVPQVRQCRGITKKGNQCRNMTDNPSGYCWQHK